MSGYGTETGATAPQKDPLRRFLVGCALVLVVLVAVVLCGALLIGWRLARDEAPGRPPEMFLVGDEARYWCIALKPDDAGLAALFARIDEINDATRRKVLEGTVLEGIPLPRRRAQLDALAPFTLELSLPKGDNTTGWAARGTFSHGVFRMRAALKVLRFLASRDATRIRSIDIDGIEVTEMHGEAAGFAVATVGNRVLIANDASRMRSVLRPTAETSGSPLPGLRALHDRIVIDGEDAWAFLSAMKLDGLSKPLAIRGAVASFDVNDRDELAFRMIVMPEEPLEGGRGAAGSPDDCSSLASAFFPGIPASAVTIDANGAHPDARGSLECSGRITGLSDRLADLVFRASDRMRRGPPSASPSPPPPPSTGDPRNDTPAVPTHGETPIPKR